MLTKILILIRDRGSFDESSDERVLVFLQSLNIRAGIKDAFKNPVRNFTFKLP